MKIPGILFCLALAAAAPGQQPAQTPARPTFPDGTPLPVNSQQVQPDTGVPARIEFGPAPSLPLGAREVASPSRNLTAAAQDQPSTPATDMHRDGVTVTAWDLDLLIRPSGHAFAARTVVTVRNDAGVPLTTLPLQISSTLHWVSVSKDGQPLQFRVAPLDSGFDHTAAVSEARIALGTPLQPGAETVVHALYEGEITQNSTRLEHLGAPADVAAQTDWDTIDSSFTGLRGMGYVVWYPISAEPVLLGDGARMFAALGRWRARHAASTMREHVRVDTSVDLETSPSASTRGTPGAALQRRPTPITAILNGQRIALRTDELGGEAAPRIADLPATAIGFDAPSLFLTAASVDSPGLHVFPLENHAASAAAYATAMEFVRPAVEQWLPPQSRDIAVAGLPGDDSSAWESAPVPQATAAGPLLAAPMPPLTAEQLAPALAQTLARASFLSPRLWLSEGVAQFMATLWASHEETGGTAMNRGLEMLDDRRSALALAEPSDGAAGSGQPLISATDDIFYRTKAAYVFWMLRGICGDAALISALKAYRWQADTRPQYFRTLLEDKSHKDLRWFFADWVDADKGLPDLRIANVISRKTGTAGDSWLVSVDVANDGYASAEIPVRVDGFGRQETQRILVPGRGQATAHIVLAAQPDSVTVNDGTTPETVASVHTTRIQPAANVNPAAN